MEYSIFLNFAYFCCVPFFLEYSWNIPYSNILDNFVVAVFVWNIPYSKSPEKTLWTKKLGIFHIPSKGKKTLWYEKIGIFHPQILEIKILSHLQNGIFFGNKKIRYFDPSPPPQYFVSIREHLLPHIT